MVLFEEEAYGVLSISGNNYGGMVRVKRVGLMLLAASALMAQAEVKLNAIFMDHMVLQRDLPARVYGTADAGEQVTVMFAGQTKRVTAGSDGQWLVALKKMKACSTPQILTVSGADNKLALSDVLVGDVWLCTGQSNMATTIDGYIKHDHGMFKEFKSIPGTYKNEMIRLFRVGNVSSDEPQVETAVGTGWAVCDPSSALTFSATGYFFGRHLQPQIGVPLGLITCAYGGTNIGSWLSKEVMESNPVARKIYLDTFNEEVANYPEAKAAYDLDLMVWKNSKKGKRPQVPMGLTHIKRPAAMYNAMLHPLQNFAVKGAIWYQGENEGSRGLSEEYKTTFKLLIDTWRKEWRQGDFPFLFVQLAAYRKVVDSPSDSDWSRQRESQLITMKTVDNTGMAVAIDGGLTQNIHPPYKNLVGKRLAAQALHVAYDKKGASQGPLFKSMKIKDGRAVLKFENIGSGLTAKTMVLDAYGKTPFKLSADKLQGFAVAGEDRVFHWADAVVDGEKVVVRSAEVANPVAVRYAWADYPLCNLYNQEGYAAVPFRTDTWAKSK